MSDSALLNLPGEIILDILSCLDHGDICNLASSCRQMLHFAKDDRIWRSAHGRSFSKGRKLIELGQWRQDYSNRISALRELLVRGTNDFHAATARKLFTEMSSENEALLKTFLVRSEISVQHLTVQCQGYVMSNVRSLLPAACLEVRPFENLHRRRIAAEPRSEVYLLRMLLARQTQQFMDVSNVEVFLRCAHLVAYNALEYPILFFPPGMIQHLRSQSRYELRSSNSMRSTVAQKPYEPTGVAGAVINWGVVETIYTLVRLYMDRMPEAIPNFVQPRDHYEPEVPMSAQMFDADLSGNWRGLYSYLDFRELEVLDSSRPFTPDFFDGMQNMKISAERPAESFSHAEKHGEENLGPNGLDVLQGLFASQSSATATDPSAVEAAQEVLYDRCRFTADGESIRGRFHIHGSTLKLPNMEPGFKIVFFDEMYNDDGIMPWIMEGVYVPSIGIIGRWRDRSEILGEAVEGPYILWRDRVQDLRDQEKLLADYRQTLSRGLSANEPRTVQTRYLPRPNAEDLAYIITETRPQCDV